MIKLLHTADLHLGKVFHDQSLAEDQAAMLDNMVSILVDDSYSALVISGDVYDRSIPSPEAVELFGAFLAKVKSAQPKLEIFIIPGNHDSQARLGFGRELFAGLNIHLGVCAEECDKPVIVEKDGEKCAFFLLPFLSHGALEADNPDDGALRSQYALAETAARRMEKARAELAERGISYSVLLAHLFAAGGMESGAERVFVGTAEQVPVTLFKGFDYVALGHLHRCQRVGDNAWYSGSPLSYSFSETVPLGNGDDRWQQEKFFLSVELTHTGAQVEKIPVKPLRGVWSFSGKFARFTADVSSETLHDRALAAAKNDYLEIRLTDGGITENAREILRSRFPNILSLRQNDAFAGLRSSAVLRRNVDGGERRSLSDDFKDFLSSVYGEEAAEESGARTAPETAAKIELFNLLLAEAEAEEVSS
ncbi:MAG: exonuclease SbcCD subunit D [Treponema sp.]|jgi:exonuclease SbcD|nr:exonuclease SbcCD subunit D [Treponema sp.]